MSAIHSFSKFRYLFDLAANAKAIVDGPEETVIPGVTLITEGPAESHFIKVGEGADAKEYQLMIDETTVDQLIAESGKYANGVKSKANHKTGIEAIFARITNVQKEKTADGKTKATGDLHLFKSFERYQQILNLLKKIPDAIGFSAYFDGPVQRIGDSFFARCQELFSIDLVGEPSTNPNGVFSLQVDSPQKDEGAGTMTPEELALAIQTAMKPHIDGLSSRLTQMEAAMPKKPADGAGNPTDDEAGMYSRFLSKAIADPKMKELVTLELQNTAKTLTALGLTPGTGPDSSIEKPTNGSGAKKIEDMTFTEVLELEFNKAENQHLRDFEIVKRTITAHPGKHRAAFERMDPNTKRMVAVNGLETLPTRRLPYKPIAA